jgi:cytochrome c biogenesis protein CcdA
VAALAFAYLAGLLTTLNPCVLPMLPLVAAGAASADRRGPLAFAAGMVLAFTALGLLVATVGLAIGLTPETLRVVAGALLAAAGLVLLVPRLQERVAFATAGLATAANGAAGRAERFGPLGGPFVVGTLAGALWSPCSGPSLGAALALAGSASGLAEAAARLAVFGAGAATMLLVFAYGARAALARGSLAATAGALKPAAGVLFLAVGLAVLTGFDRRVEAALLDLSPDWLVTLTTRF